MSDDPESLPGSDPALLAGIGEQVRMRLAALPWVRAAPVLEASIFTFENFLSPAECAGLIALIDSDAAPSSVFRAGGAGDMRTSDTCRLASAHPLVAAIDARLASLLGLPPEHGETLQGQRYRPGQEFKEHNDYFAAGQPYSEAVAAEGGQRTWTAMAYLGGPEAGGATAFPALGLDFAPRAGMLLAWNNLDWRGLPNRYTHHAGRPVKAGTKYVLTKWYREREWTPGAAAAFRS